MLIYYISDCYYLSLKSGLIKVKKQKISTYFQISIRNCLAFFCFFFFRLSSSPNGEDFLLLAEENVADNVEERKDKCRGKSLAAFVRHPSRPTISEREAITISSTFTARPLPLSFFIYVFFLFSCFSPTLIFILFSSPSLSLSLLPLVVCGSGHISSYAAV